MLKSSLKAKDKLIVALDTSDLDTAKRLIDELRDHTGMFKVGLELFTHSGTKVFDLIEKETIKVFFDGKFMDIPNTVARAAANIAAQRIAMLNIHASGGLAMMKAAADAVRDQAEKSKIDKPILIAVTVLTSVDANALKNELSVSIPVEDHVVKLATLTKQAGLDGVVASAREARLIKASLGPDFVIVTPGIRPDWASTDDQARIVTPSQAIKNGSDYLVVGRPITGAVNKKDAAARVVEEMEEALASS
ncbi:orotidine-5'-phosphate decarboxylase [bacterium]|nr:orotidine-5'-phosphate decarboxylase [bacterium]